ncbi:MAG TPA: hypothetical protein VN520_38155, partial [Streptomyces sp.]|uniref:DUF6907 domain-containing protein n=1 Tax=Streptomyces sp. TaxID=1931 RepID=UPI002BD27A71
IRSEFRWMRGDTVLAWSEDEYRAKVEQIRADVAQSLTHLPCLPGCVEDHVAQWLSSEVCECWVPPAPVALVESAIEGREVAVMAGACMTYGASPSTLIYVGLSSSDTEDHAELTSEKARRLAAALIAAADEADAIVADVEG